MPVEEVGLGPDRLWLTWEKAGRDRMGGATSHW